MLEGVALLLLGGQDPKGHLPLVLGAKHEGEGATPAGEAGLSRMEASFKG